MGIVFNILGQYKLTKYRAKNFAPKCKLHSDFQKKGSSALTSSKNHLYDDFLTHLKKSGYAVTILYGPACHIAAPRIQNSLIPLTPCCSSRWSKI